MRDDVVFCLPSTPIDAVAKLMSDNQLNEIIVLIDRRPVGFVVQEDIVACLARGDIVLTGSDFATRPPSTDVQAREVLRHPPLLVDKWARMSDAVALMRRQGRRLAVVTHEDETVVGMVTPLEVVQFESRPTPEVHGDA